MLGVDNLPKKHHLSQSLLKSSHLQRRLKSQLNQLNQWLKLLKLSSLLLRQSLKQRIKQKLSKNQRKSSNNLLKKKVLGEPLLRKRRSKMFGVLLQQRSLLNLKTQRVHLPSLKRKNLSGAHLLLRKKRLSGARLLKRKRRLSRLSGVLLLLRKTKAMLGEPLLLKMKSLCGVLSLPKRKNNKLLRKKRKSNKFLQLLLPPPRRRRLQRKPPSLSLNLLPRQNNKRSPKMTLGQQHSRRKMKEAGPSQVKRLWQSL